MRFRRLPRAVRCSSLAVAAASRAASVRVWNLMSPRTAATGGHPPPEGAKVGYAPAIRADVREGAAVRAMVGEVLALFGWIDVLVNNAGILNDIPLHEMTEETWDEMMATNLRPVFLCSRAVLPHVLARGSGKIINMSSLLAQKGMTGRTHYVAAKGGVLAFTRALAREVGPRGIQVNAIAPGLIETELVGSITDEIRRERSAILALRRIAGPEEVAPTAVFLASHAASYYSGQTLSPNGGDTML